jgi:hypothetical protein
MYNVTTNNGVQQQQQQERIKLYKADNRITAFINTETSREISRIWGSHSGGYEEFCLLGYNVM